MFNQFEFAHGEVVFEIGYYNVNAFKYERGAMIINNCSVNEIIHILKIEGVDDICFFCLIYDLIQFNKTFNSIEIKECEMNSEHSELKFK